MTNKIDWIIHGVIPKEGDLDYAMDYHTHGLREFHNHPELMIVLSIRDEVAVDILNSIGLCICDGEKFDEERIYTNILANNLPTKMVKARMGDEDVMVIVFPDSYGKLPGEEGCEEPYNNQIKIIEFFETRYKLN